MFSHSVDEKIELRLPEERHAEQIYALVRRNLARLKRWMPWATDDYALQHAHDFIRRNLQQFADNQGFSASIFYEGRLAGSIGLNWINWQNRKTEIGYWLSEDLEGRGIMTRSCRALVNHAFGQLNLNRVEMYVGVANDKSRRIPERLGFRPEGTLLQAEWLHDHFNDLVLYAMLAEEWKEKGSGG